MAEVDIERYYLDYDKWMRLLEYIEEDGQIPEQEWDKYINYSYSRKKFIKKIKKFREKNNRQPNQEEKQKILLKMKSILIPCSLWEERYFLPINWDTEIFFKNIRAKKIMGYTLIGTNDPINNPYTVFNLLSINIDYNQWKPSFIKIVGSGISGRFLNWKVYPELNNLFKAAGFNNVGREFKSILKCLTHIFMTKDKFMTKDGNESIRNDNIDNLSVQLNKYEVFTKPYAYPFGSYSVKQIAEFTNNEDMLKFIDAANWRYKNIPAENYYLMEEINNPPPHESDSLSDTSLRVASPRVASLRQPSPRVASPRQPSPRVASPRQISPIVASPRQPSPRVESIVVSPRLANPVASPRVASPRQSPQSSAQTLRNPSNSSLKLSSYKQSSFRQSSRRAETMRINRTNPKTKRGVLWGNIKKCENEYKKIAQLEDKIDSLTSTKEEQIFIKNKTAKKLTKEFDKLTRFNRKLIDRLNELTPDINYNSKVSELSKSSESLHNSLETMRISRSQPIIKKGYLWGDVKKCIQETEKIDELKNTIDGLYKEIKEEKKIKQETVKLLINNNKKLTKENNNLKFKIKNITQQRRIFGIGRGYNKTKKQKQNN